MSGIKTSRKEEGLKKIGILLAECFRGISEYFIFSSETLSLFIDLIDEPNWKF